MNDEFVYKLHVGTITLEYKQRLVSFVKTFDKYLQYYLIIGCKTQCWHSNPTHATVADNKHLQKLQIKAEPFFAPCAMQ